jgi:hypothetical protein
MALILQAFAAEETDMPRWGLGFKQSASLALSFLFPRALETGRAFSFQCVGPIADNGFLFGPLG